VETLIGRHWHSISSQEVARFLESDIELGLDQFEVRRRQEHFGPNRITEGKKTSPFVLFLQQFNQSLLYVLMAAGLITLFMLKWVEAAFIFGVVLINAIIGFLQESKAVEAMEALMQTMETQTTVIRAGKQVRFTLLVICSCIRVEQLEPTL
jgi:Ca2+-transporting ATPase